MMSWIIEEPPHPRTWGSVATIRASVSYQIRVSYPRYDGEKKQLSLVFFKKPQLGEKFGKKAVSNFGEFSDFNNYRPEWTDTNWSL